MEDRYNNIQGTIPPTKDVNNANRYANIQGATPIEEKKKDVVPEETNVVSETNNQPQVPPSATPNPKQNTVSNLFNQYSTIINIASSTNKDISDKPVSKIGKMFTTPNEFRSKYMPKSKQKEFEQTNPNAIQISTSQPIKKQANKWDSNEKVDDSDKLRLDGTDKGKGFYGEITVQSGKDKGKKITELSVGYEVDGKEILTPLLNPYTSLDDIENVRAGGQPSEQMHRDAKKWLFYCLKNNRSPFATEEETINLYTDEDNKIKFQTATDFQRYVANTMTEDDKKVLVGEANTYPIGSVQYKDYANKEASRDMLNEQMEQFAKDTGFEPQAYLAYQDYLIKGGTSFEDWKKEYNPQSKIGMDEALVLTVATLPTLIYDVVYRDGDMIKRIAKGTNEFATGVRTSSIMGDLSYIIQGLFTLTKEGKYNPFKAAGELKQTDVKWFNRFDLNAKDEVALFMGSIGVDYLPFEVAGKVSSKMLQTLVKPGALNYYDFLIKTNAVPETALTATEKIFQGSFQMGTTLGLYSGAQSTLNQLMYSTPKQFISDGWQTVLNDVTHSTLTGYIAGGIGGATGVLTNQVKNKIISDAMKNGIMDATKLQKFAYVGTGVAGVTLSTILEASTFVAMSGEELNTKNILKESIKFATLKFQNPAGLKIDKLRNKMTVDPNFKPETAWEGRFEPKLNEAELAMLGCKNVSEAKELVKRDGLEAVTADIPTATAFKLLYAETGIVTPTKAVDFAPDKVTITTENINGKEYSVVNTYNKQGELTHISPHENYKDAATEVEFITNKMQEYKVYKAADRIKPEWYAEFNQTANVDKIALNDALQAKDPTPEQLATIKEFNKQVDDFIAKKEKEVTVEKPKKKEKAETETVASEVKEEVMTLNDKEYTVRENEVFVKNEQGLLTRETDNDIIKQVKEKQNDTQDKAGLPSEVQQGEKPIETKSVESTGEKEIATGGDVQTPKEKEVAQSNKTQAFAVIKEFNKQVDDFISKKEKETPVIGAKKPEPPKEETKPVEIKEETITLNDKEYTVTETADKTTVMVKDAYGKKEPVRNTDIEKEVLAEYNKDKATEKAPEKEFEVVTVDGKDYKVRKKEDGTYDVMSEKNNIIPEKGVDGKNIAIYEKIVGEFDRIKKLEAYNFAKEISSDVTKTNTKQKEEQLRKQKEAEAEIELDKLVEKKTDEVMRDIKADYDGTIKLGNKTFLIKKKSGRKLEVYVVNENGNLIPIDDAAALSFVNKTQDITPMSKSFIKKVKQVAIDKFLSENEAIVDVAYKEIENYRAEQYDLIQKRIESEVMQETSKYQAERDKLYNEGKLKTQGEVVIPENMEKHKSNFIGDLNKTKDIDKSLAEIRKEKWFKELNGDSQDVVHATLRDLGEKHLKTVGRQAKMTKEEMSPASQEKFDISFRTYLKDMEAAVNKAVKIGVSQTKKAVKDLKKYTEEDFKTFINDIRKAHTEVSKYLTPAENKSILTQIEAGVKAGTKASVKSVEKIGEILEKAQDRLIQSDIASMEKWFDNFLETTKVNKQKKQVESRTGKEFTDFTKKVKEVSMQEPSIIETKLEETYDKIISGTEAEANAAKAEVEALIYAQDYSAFNQNKQVFENAASTRTEKMIAYYEMMDICDKFLSKNPVESYRKAVDEKMKIIEKEKAEVQKKVEIMQNPDLKVEDIPKTNELFDITDNLRISTKDKKNSLTDLSESINNSETFSVKDKAKLNKAIDKVKNNPLITSKNAMADKILKSVGLTKMQKDVTRERPKAFKNPLRRMLNRFDNLQQMGKVLGWKNREIRDYFTDITDKADNAAIRSDKMTNDRMKDIEKLREMIYGNNDILSNWTNRSEELGIKETLIDAEGKPFTDFNKLSYNDILYIDRLLKTPQNKEIISKVYGEDAVNIIQRHCEEVMKNPNLKEISDFVFENLQNKIYDINNEQYVKENGVDLPKFEDYVARFAVKSDKVIGKTDVKGSLKPSATRVRTVARQLKTDVNIVDMIDNAYKEAIKYNAFSDVNTEMRRVLMNDSVRNTILTKVAEGDVVWKNLNKLYEAYPEGSKINETIVPKIISNAVIAKLRMNPTMVIKQASSASNSYADYIKTIGNQKLNLVPALVETMYAKELLPDKYTGQFLKSAINNKALQTRLQTYGIDPHLADYMQKTFIEMGLDKIGVTKNANMIKFFRALEKLKDVQGLPVKYGDIAAFWGAKPLFNIYYKEALNKGMSKEQAGDYAIDQAYKSWSKTNQSIWSHNMSAFQLSPVGKLFAYYTSPIQMGQQTRGAIRDILSPSSTPMERVNGAKSLAYYAAFQKTIFMLAGAASTGLVKFSSKSLGQLLGYNTNPEDSFEDLLKMLDIPDEKMDVISKILQHQSATQGIPVIDELITIVGNAMEEGKYSDKDIISTVGMIEKIGNNVGKITDIISKKGFEDWTDKEKREIIRFTAQIGDMFTGYGISPANRIIEYVTGKDILNDSEKTKKEDSAFGTSGGYKNESKPFGN